MNQVFFNRLLHLLKERPQQGKRMVGLGADALWELWQLLAEVERAERVQQAQRPERKRQVGGGRKKEAEVLCRLLVTLLYLRQHALDASDCGNERLCGINGVELHP